MKLRMYVMVALMSSSLRSSAGFIRVGNRFLGGGLGDVYQVNLEQELPNGGELEEGY